MLGPDALPQDTGSHPQKTLGTIPMSTLPWAPPGNGPVLCEYQVEGAVTPN